MAGRRKKPVLLTSPQQQSQAFGVLTGRRCFHNRRHSIKKSSIACWKWNYSFCRCIFNSLTCFLSYLHLPMGCDGPRWAGFMGRCLMAGLAMGQHGWDVLAVPITATRGFPWHWHPFNHTYLFPHQKSWHSPFQTTAGNGHCCHTCREGLSQSEWALGSPTIHAVSEVFLLLSLCLQSTASLATLKSFYLTTRCQTTARGSPSSLFLECFSQLPQVRWVLSSPPQAHLLGRFFRLLVKPMGWHDGIFISPSKDWAILANASGPQDSKLF